MVEGLKTDSSRVWDIIVAVAGFVLGGLVTGLLLDLVAAATGEYSAWSGWAQFVIGFLGFMALWVCMMWVVAKVMRKFHINTTWFE